MKINLNDRIQHFSILGQFLNQFANKKYKNLEDLNTKFYDRFLYLINYSYTKNPWFTPQNILFSIQGITKFLQKEILEKWTSNYRFKENPKTIALILAGNIPLVGFHDILSVLISGNHVLAKLSSKDDELIKIIREILIEINPAWEEKFSITNQILKNFDAVIATGSNNSARYFDYYFGKYPHIIRKNRNAVAVLSGKENKEELQALSDDIYLYFGLGCRNVSKIFVPESYDFQPLFEATQKYKELINHHKYANNYEYRRAIFLVNSDEHFDNGFTLFKPDKAIASPIAVVNYEFYKNIDDINAQLIFEQDKIQCIVSNAKGIKNALPPGSAQFPEVWDYADNIDTLKFLTEL